MREQDRIGDAPKILNELSELQTRVSSLELAINSALKCLNNMSDFNHFIHIDNNYLENIIHELGCSLAPSSNNNEAQGE